MKRIKRNMICAAVALVSQTAFAGGEIQDIFPLQISTFGGIDYIEYQARFRGSTPRGAYDLPCLVVEPIVREEGNGTVLLELVNTASVGFPGGGEIAFGRYQLTDQMLFGRGFSYATIRWDKRAIGGNWPPIDFTHVPGPLTTGDRYDGPEADAFDIIVDFAKELRSTGIGTRVYSYGYSNSARFQRGLLISGFGQGVFDFSLVGARGAGISLKQGKSGYYQYSFDSTIPPITAGKVIAFHTETEVVEETDWEFRAWDVRTETTNYRNYEMAGVAHGSREVVAAVGLPDSETANPFMGNEVVRALFIAGHLWTTEGIEPPPSAWFGPAGDSTVERDENGNGTISAARLALLPAGVNGPIRLPDVEVGRGTYLGVDPVYFQLYDNCNPATCDPITEATYLFRLLGGSFFDLEFVPLPDGSPRFESHGDYVSRVTDQAMLLLEQGYLLEEDAMAIIDAAGMSDIGKQSLE